MDRMGFILMLKRLISYTPWGIEDKEERRRFNQHLPVGALAILPGIWHPWIGMTLVTLCVAYEYLNGFEKKDKSYKDLLGIAWGAGMMAYLLWLLDTL